MMRCLTYSGTPSSSLWLNGKIAPPPLRYSGKKRVSELGKNLNLEVLLHRFPLNVQKCIRAKCLVRLGNFLSNTFATYSSFYRNPWDIMILCRDSDSFFRYCLDEKHTTYYFSKVNRLEQ